MVALRWVVWGSMGWDCGVGGGVLLGGYNGVLFVGGWFLVCGGLG